MKQTLLSKSRSIVDSAIFNILVGLVLLLCGLSEAINEYQEIEKIRIGSHHGVIIFAFFQVLRNTIDGLSRIEKARTREI
ncbi:hypothetical protein A9Q84_14905 [Halobacteriovorax marinus]|uniref:Uncharacterized protein n=1 Tax=Halobacteriovorax marinus TaxID=97084 RepID=A0A1Y5F5F1_9BACT|nr:hypothetical protein A9Q84_14905 [Halobacteriovorax marinus]